MFSNCLTTPLSRLKYTVMLCLLFLLTSNTVNGQAADPWENSNRKLHGFNDYFDTLLIRPIAATYSTLLPRFVRQGIGNFFSNIDDINVTVNDVLQFKFYAAASDSGRFLINSTIGLVGTIDVATSMGLGKNEEDFGQTFAQWGIPSGPYVVVPAIGPSTVRDVFGLVFDSVFNPFQYSDAYYSRTALFLVEEIDARASVLALDELIFGDRYIFLREAYLQRRDYLIADGEIENAFGDF